MLDFDNENYIGVAMCDSCGEEETFHVETFDTLVYAAREEGWYTEYTDNGFEHYCPDCNIDLSLNEE